MIEREITISLEMHQNLRLRGSLVDPQILYQVGPKQPGHISSCIPIQAPIHAGMSPKSFFWLQECMMKPIIFCFERGS